MIDHLGIECADARKSIAFYEAVLPTVGYNKAFEHPNGAAFGEGDDSLDFDEQGTLFFVDQAGEEKPTARVHVAFRAHSRQAVEDFYRAAIAAGAREHFAPGVIPEYHEHYFATFVFDLDGHKIEAVCHDGGPRKPS